MKIKGEGIIFSEELYFNYLYQFGFKEAKKYRVRTFRIKDLIRLTLALATASVSIKLLGEILDKK